MASMIETDANVNISLADRLWAAAALATDEHHADGPTPAECLVEPGEDPEDPEGWAYWDRFVWEPGQAGGDDDLGPWPTDAEIEDYYRESRESSGWPSDHDQAEFRPL